MASCNVVANKKRKASPPYELQHIVWDRVGFIDQPNLERVNGYILKAVFYDPLSDRQYYFSVPSKECFALAMADKDTTSVLDSIGILGFFKLPPWGVDIQRCVEALHSFDPNTSQMTVTGTCPDQKITFELSPDLIAEALHLPRLRCLWNSRRLLKQEEKDQIYKIAPGNNAGRPYWSELICPRLELSCRLIMQFFSFNKPHRFTHPEQTLLATLHKGRPTNFSEGFFKEIRTKAISKTSPNAYLGFGLALTRAIYRAAPELGRLPAPLEAQPRLKKSLEYTPLSQEKRFLMDAGEKRDRIDISEGPKEDEKEDKIEILATEMKIKVEEKDEFERQRQNAERNIIEGVERQRQKQNQKKTELERIQNEIEVTRAGKGHAEERRKLDEIQEQECHPEHLDDTAIEGEGCCPNQQELITEAASAVQEYLFKQAPLPSLPFKDTIQGYAQLLQHLVGSMVKLSTGHAQQLASQQCETLQTKEAEIKKLQKQLNDARVKEAQMEKELQNSKHKFQMIEDMVVQLSQRQHRQMKAKDEEIMKLQVTVSDTVKLLEDEKATKEELHSRCERLQADYQRAMHQIISLNAELVDVQDAHRRVVQDLTEASVVQQVKERHYEAAKETWKKKIKQLKAKVMLEGKDESTDSSAREEEEISSTLSLQETKEDLLEQITVEAPEALAYRKKPMEFLKLHWGLISLSLVYQGHNVVGALSKEAYNAIHLQIPHKVSVFSLMAIFMGQVSLQQPEVIFEQRTHPLQDMFKAWCFMIKDCDMTEVPELEAIWWERPYKGNIKLAEDALRMMESARGLTWCAKAYQSLCLKNLPQGFVAEGIIVMYTRIIQQLQRQRDEGVLFFSTQHVAFPTREEVAAHNPNELSTNKSLLLELMKRLKLELPSLLHSPVTSLTTLALSLSIPSTSSG